MFRRRRVENADEQSPEEAQDNLLGTGDMENGRAGARDSVSAPRDGGVGADAPRGPWDVTDAYPERERIDLGSLQVPAAPGFDVQVNVTGDRALAVVVVRGDSTLQLQAFAAPKRAGLWDEVRHELVDELNTAGGRGEEAEGPFGLEVRARVPMEPGAGQHGLQPARFLGADGPRWFLRGVISGSAAAHPAKAKPLEDVFADIVVVRGEHPMPPRDLLELRLPAEAQQALEEQMAEAADGREPLNPFVRGPEITETR